MVLERLGHGRPHDLVLNAGVEGPSEDAHVSAQRLRLQRALLASALLAQGTPMLQAGDEMGRTQRGNNNAYCQDNWLSWIDWAVADGRLAEFTGAVIALRRALPALRQDHWLDDHPQTDGGREVQWLTPARDGETIFSPAAVEGAAARAPGAIIIPATTATSTAMRSLFIVSSPGNGNRF
jgi:glycogen operon protein